MIAIANFVETLLLRENEIIIFILVDIYLKKHVFNGQCIFQTEN